MKICCKCKVYKISSEFHKDKHTDDGFTPRCRDCRNLALRTKRKIDPNNKEKQRIKAREFRLKNPNYYRRDYIKNAAKRRKASLDCYHKNKHLYTYKKRTPEARAKAREETKKYRSTDGGRDTVVRYRLNNSDKLKELGKNHYINNKHVYIAKDAKRRARKLKATPQWLTPEHLKLIELFYKNCPKDHHVDHIVPLQGKTVSGLHVIWNLQYLTAVQNLAKGNKLIKELA